MTNIIKRRGRFKYTVVCFFSLFTGAHFYFRWYLLPRGLPKSEVTWGLNKMLIAPFAAITCALFVIALFLFEVKPGGYWKDLDFWLMAVNCVPWFTAWMSHANREAQCYHSLGASRKDATYSYFKLKYYSFESYDKSIADLDMYEMYCLICLSCADSIFMASEERPYQVS